jgi:putative peptide zinc metalloprotease protein
VLVIALGCRNLWRVNQLVVKRRFLRLSAEEARELAEAHERDLRVARWYRWLYLAGLAWAAWYFAKFFLPATITLLGWIAASLRADPGTARFWQGLLFALLALLPLALTIGVLAWERLPRRPAAPG